MDVHLSNYSSHNSVQIVCDKSWTEPKWGSTTGLTEVPEVYESDDGRLYTFVKNKTTCEKCLE